MIDSVDSIEALDGFFNQVTDERLECLEELWIPRSAISIGKVFVLAILDRELLSNSNGDLVSHELILPVSEVLALSNEARQEWTNLGSFSSTNGDMASRKEVSTLVIWLLGGSRPLD